jgi:ABC-type oligopeptide transport system ATPase subunit
LEPEKCTRRCERDCNQPTSYLESQFATLRQTFADIAPTVAPERIDAAVRTFLRCISDEVMNIPQLAPIYQLQLEKISLQQGHEMIAALKDGNEIQQRALMALLEVSNQQNRLLLTGLRGHDQLQLNEVDLQELKARYFRSICEKYAVMDLGGISPRVASKTGGRMVSVQMEDVFIPLRAREDFTDSGVSRRLIEKLCTHLGVTPLAAYQTLQESLTSLETQWQTEDTVAKWMDTLRMRLDVDVTLTEALDVLKEERANIAVVLDETQMSWSRANKSMKALVGLKKILEYRKVVVLGHPGSGKTTIGKYIAYAVAKGKGELIGERLGTYIPIIVKAAAYGKFLNKEEHLSFNRYVTGEKYSDDYGPLFQWALKNNQCLVIIDGLDEVPDATLRMRVAERIEQFVSDYPENQFLVTSRIVGYKGNQLTGNFVHFTLTELEKEQIIVFLENWYKAVTGKKTQTGEEECKQRARDLWRDIDAKEGVKKLAGTPLLLTIIALVNYYGSRLPDRRVELYQLAAETLLSNWPLKQREQNIDAREILSILEPIAYKIFTTSKDRLITEYEFRPLFEEQIRKAQGVSVRKAKTIGGQLLDKIARDTGFFLSRGTNEKGQDVYGFLHPTFAEYLTARYLADQWLGYRGSPEHKLEFAAYVHDASWHEVVLLIAGHLGTMADRLATQFVETLEKLESPCEEYLHRDLLLIAEIIGDNVPVSREKRDEIVSSLISIALDTTYLSLWQSILERLGDIALAFPFINQPKQLKLQENDDIVRRVPKTILSRRLGVQKKTDFATLFQGLFADEETSRLAEKELASIIEALRMSAKGNVVTHLLVIKKDRSTRYLRIPKQVAEEIKNIPLPIHGVEALVGMGIDFDKNAPLVLLLDLQQISQLGALRIASLITTFEKRGDRYGLSLLLVALEYSESYIAILNELTQQVSSKDKSGDYQIVLNALEKLISRAMSLKRLTKVSEVSEWRETLQFLVMSDEESEIRAKALKVLLLLPQKEKEQLEAIMRGLNDPEKEVRLIAAEMSRVPLRKKPEPQLVERLKELLANVDSSVRIASARSIIRAERFKEEDILSLLEVICEPSAEFIEKRELRERGVDLIFLANHASQPVQYLL